MRPSAARKKRCETLKCQGLPTTVKESKYLKVGSPIYSTLSNRGYLSLAIWVTEVTLQLVQSATLGLWVTGVTLHPPFFKKQCERMRKEIFSQQHICCVRRRGGWEGLDK